MVRQFSVLVKPASDIDDQWVAHCLNWDVVTQGTSPNHAVLMLMEALEIVIADDDQDDFDSDLRPSAPAELWNQFSEIQFHGTRISPADAKQLSSDRSASYAMILHRLESRKAPDIGEVEGHMPPPFVVQALQENHKAGW